MTDNNRKNPCKCADDISLDRCAGKYAHAPKDCHCAFGRCLRLQPNECPAAYGFHDGWNARGVFDAQAAQITTAVPLIPLTDEQQAYLRNLDSKLRYYDPETIIGDVEAERRRQNNKHGSTDPELQAAEAVCRAASASAVKDRQIPQKTEVETRAYVEAYADRYIYDRDWQSFLLGISAATVFWVAFIYLFVK